MWEIFTFKMNLESVLIFILRIFIQAVQLLVPCNGTDNTNITVLKLLTADCE